MKGAWVATTLVLGILWFTVWAPEVDHALLANRAAAPRTPSAGDIERSWQMLAATDPSQLPNEAVAAQLRAGLIKARELQRRQERLTEAIWSTLSTTEHKQGAALLGTVELPRYEADIRFVEPDGPTLAFALMSQYGNTATEVAPLPQPDPSTNRHAQLQIAAVLAQTEKLTPDQAAQMLWSTLEIIEVQRQLRDLEQELTTSLNPALTAALGPNPSPKAAPPR